MEVSVKGFGDECDLSVHAETLVAFAERAENGGSSVQACDNLVIGV